MFYSFEYGSLCSWLSECCVHYDRTCVVTLERLQSDTLNNPAALWLVHALSFFKS